MLGVSFVVPVSLCVSFFEDMVSEQFIEEGTCISAVLERICCMPTYIDKLVFFMLRP